MATPEWLARPKHALRVRPFRRLWLVLGLSSLGDWVGLLATSAFAANAVTGQAAKGFAFGGVVAVRLLPALLLGPPAGILADRFDRRHTLVVCDALRFALFASIPTVGLLVAAPAVVVGWAAIATVLVEAVGMVWSPTKEAAVPNLVPKEDLEAANQLSLATTYGISPVLGGLVVAVLNAAVGTSLLPVTGTDVALYFNAVTFLANALVVWHGIREIGGRVAAGERRPSALREFADGWHHVGHVPLVRGLTGGIVVAFAVAGTIVGTALFYARSLHGGEASFGLLFGFLFAGLGVGVTTGPLVVHDLSRRRWFGVSLVLAGGSVAVLAAAPHLVVALLGSLTAGVGAGMALLAGMTLLGGEVVDDVRGRVFAFVQTGCRVVLLLSIFTSSVLVGVGVPVRLILLVAGVGMAAAGAFTLRLIDDRAGMPILADLRAALRGRGDAGPERGDVRH